MKRKINFDAIKTALSRSEMREIMAGSDGNGGGGGGGGCTGIQSCFTNWSSCTGPNCISRWVCESLSCTCEYKWVTLNGTTTKKCNY